MSDEVVAVLGGLGLVLLFIALVILGPILLIWSLNTLFGLGIPVTIKTWFAAWFIALSVKSDVHVQRNKS